MAGRSWYQPAAAETSVVGARPGWAGWVIVAPLLIRPPSDFSYGNRPPFRGFDKRTGKTDRVSPGFGVKRPSFSRSMNMRMWVAIPLCLGRVVFRRLLVRPPAHAVVQKPQKIRLGLVLVLVAADRHGSREGIRAKHHRIHCRCAIKD